MVRNECFRAAMDYLFKKGLISDQSELSKLTGISEVSISRIINNKVKEPSEATIRKLNEAFGNRFNPEYFRGHSIHMLMEDALYYAQHPEEDPANKQYAPFNEHEKPSKQIEEIPTWADTLIGIMSEQVKQNEAINRELRQSIAEVQALRDELRTIIRGQYTIPVRPSAYLATAEPQKY